MANRASTHANLSRGFCPRCNGTKIDITKQIDFLCKEIEQMWRQIKKQANDE